MAGSEGTSGSDDEASTVRTKPQVLWSLYFNCVETSKSYLSPNVPQNVHLCSGPDLELDFEFSVQQVSYSMHFHTYVTKYLILIQKILNL